MLKEELIIKFSNKKITKNFEVLIWYDGPKMYVDKNKEILLSWYQDFPEEKWFLVKNSKGIKEYIKNQKTLRDLLLEGETFLAIYDFNKDKYIVIKKLSQQELKKNFVLPSKNSFLGNLSLLKANNKKGVKNG